MEVLQVIAAAGTTVAAETACRVAAAAAAGARDGAVGVTAGSLGARPGAGVVPRSAADPGGRGAASQGVGCADGDKTSTIGEVVRRVAAVPGDTRGVRGGMGHSRFTDPTALAGL